MYSGVGLLIGLSEEVQRLLFHAVPAIIYQELVGPLLSKKLLPSPSHLS